MSIPTPTVESLAAVRAVPTGTTGPTRRPEDPFHGPDSGIELWAVADIRPTEGDPRTFLGNDDTWQAQAATAAGLDPDGTQAQDPAVQQRLLDADVAARGLLDPLRVTPCGNLLDGHHRLAAAKTAGLTHVPAKVRLDDDWARCIPCIPCVDPAWTARLGLPHPYARD